MEPFEIMVSESQERMLCVCEPDRLDEVLAVCEKWEVHGTAIGVVTDGGRLRVLDGERVVGDVPVVALVDECPLYDLEPAAPCRPAVRAAGGDARRGRRCARDAPCAAREPEHRLAPAALPAVRLDRAVADRAPPGRGRRRGPAAPRRQRDRRRHRRLRPQGRRGPVHGHDRERPRVRGEPRVRRCRAARADELPELRQPGEVPHRVAALREHPRPRRRLSRARRAGGGRQRLALQRGRRGPDLPHARRRARGRDARCRARRRPGVRGRGRRRRVSSARSRPRFPAPSWPSCAARRCPTASRRRTSRPCARRTTRSARRSAPER